jgi:hypothetical protein
VIGTAQERFDFEATAKEAVLSEYEDRAPALLAGARRIAHRLARDGNAVTVDQVRAEMEARGDLPPGYPRDFLGALFLERDESGRRVWTKAGAATSRTPGRKCSHIWQWRLA